MMSRCGVKYFSMRSSAVVSLAPVHQDVFRVDLSTGIGAGVDADAAASTGAAGAPTGPHAGVESVRTCVDHLSSANIRTKTPTPTDRALRVLIVSPSLLLLHRQRRFCIAVRSATSFTGAGTEAAAAAPPSTSVASPDPKLSHKAHCSAAP